MYRRVLVAFILVPLMRAAPNLQLNGGQSTLIHGFRIAFNGDREGQGAPDEIYVINADGTGERRVTPTNHTCNAIAPRWSPSGQQIAFHCAEPGNTTSDIFVINDDGTGMRQLTHVGLATFASWSPDGMQIAFTVVNPGNTRLYLVDVKSGLLTQLTRGGRPDWSPDGRRLAVNRNGVIYVIERDDPEHAMRLTDSTSVNVNPRWSPDGRKITFESTRDGNREIYVMNADGSDQVRLTRYSGIDAVPAWSPDGRWIVFHRQLCDPSVLGQSAPNGSDLFIVAVDGSQQIQVTRGACRGAPGGTFSANSTFSAFASWAPGR